MSVVAEKVPLFLIALATGIVTILAHRRTGGLSGLAGLPLALRLGNASIAVFSYLAKTVWPAGHVVFYPHLRDSLPGLLPASILSAALLTVAYILRRRAPFVAVRIEAR